MAKVRVSLTQDDIVIRGHAIQCRLNAEDTTNFAPSREDYGSTTSHRDSAFDVTHAHPGYEMPGCFDSLLAKLLWGPDRDSAVRRMRTALDETMITGVEHLIPTSKNYGRERFPFWNIPIAYIDEHQELLDDSNGRTNRWQPHLR